MAHENRASARDFAFLCLRIGLGVFFLRAGWAKVEHISGVVGLWQRLHLPLPGFFGPIHAAVEFGGALLILLGLFTRPAAILLAVDMLGALFLVKIHTPTFFSQEWLAFWISLALLLGGAGTCSLDAMRHRNSRGAG
ncbi:MAG TPA: DoxX family protein [bacterium]|nr:DoxX family protein [bacterium]